MRAILWYANYISIKLLEEEPNRCPLKEGEGPTFEKPFSQIKQCWVHRGADCSSLVSKDGSPHIQCISPGKLLTVLLAKHSLHLPEGCCEVPGPWSVSHSEFHRRGHHDLFMLRVPKISTSPAHGSYKCSPNSSPVRP